MTKAIILFVVSGMVLIGSSMASFVVSPPGPPKTRTILAGRAFVSVPINLPPEVIHGTSRSGSAILGSKDDCDITYDQFLVVSWSEHAITAKEIIPTKAYKIRSEGSRQGLEIGRGRLATVRNMNLSAKKPCGKVVVESVKIVEQYCEAGKTFVAVAGKLDPYMTPERVLEVAGSLKCP